MDFLRHVDFDALARGEGRLSLSLLDASSGASACAVTCVRTPAGGGSPEGLHTHTVDQLFYILSGTMSIEVAGDTHEAGPGTLVVFPAGVPHRNWNAGVAPTIHLSFVAPLPDPAARFATPVGGAA